MSPEADNSQAIEPAPKMTRRGQHIRSGLQVLALTILYTYAFIDRSILALLVEPIKVHLRISDTQMSLLLGVAFAAFYSLLNVPAGYLVDRFSRRKLIGYSALAWSLMTVACGLAHSFIQLFVGRAGVGLAEAVITPAAFCIIREQVPPALRGRAFSIFGAGPFLGGGLSLLVGGAAMALAADGYFARVPWLGNLQPWQLVLALVGSCGLPLCLLASILPSRPATRAEPATAVTFAAAGSYMWANRKVYGALFTYGTFGAMLAFGKSAWAPAMLGRTWNLPPATVGYYVGMLTLTVAPVGLICGGYALDWLSGRGIDTRRYGMLAAVLSAATMIATPFMPTLATMLGVYALGLVFSGVFYTVGAATLTEITPLRMMGKVTATYLMLQGTLSQAGGPFLIAFLSDGVFHHQGRLAVCSATSAAGIVMGVPSILALGLLTRRMKAWQRSGPATTMA